MKITEEQKQEALELVMEQMRQFHNEFKDNPSASHTAGMGLMSGTVESDTLAAEWEAVFFDSDGELLELNQIQSTLKYRRMFLKY